MLPHSSVKNDLTYVAPLGMGTSGGFNCFPAIGTLLKIDGSLRVLKRLGRYHTSAVQEQPEFRSCLMIDLGCETDGNNEIRLGVRFALCIIKALQLARIEHCSGTVAAQFLLPSLNRSYNIVCGNSQANWDLL